MDLSEQEIELIETFRKLGITTGKHEEKKSDFKSEQEKDLEDALKDQGESQNQPDDKYDLGQLTNGTFVETEHTDDLKAAKEIAKDHLEEDPQYYSKGDFPEEAEEAKDKIVSDENCKNKACSDGNKKDMPGDFKSRVLSDRRMKLIRGFAESFGGAK